MDRQTDKMWKIEETADNKWVGVWCIDTVEYYTAVKKTEAMNFPRKQRELEHFQPTEVTQTQ